MSKVIDDRVVSLRFDNKSFETNVSNTMSTLDRLKQKLNIPASAKAFQNINTEASKVNLSGISSAVNNLQVNFRALDVVGVTALANITNAAIRTGKNMIKALTITPIMSGFNEYETKINAVQTIISNTANKGTKMADVTRVLDELNTYADKTIYNFAEMTRNIGTFTAAGIGLEDAAAAIQGIANLAAASGSSSQQASVAMYQLSQALAAGTVKLMDWNSVVNAGMGGQKFQEALKATAREHGIAVDEIIKKQGSFRESLQEGWISADILNETLKKFTVEGAKEYASAMVKSGKYTQEQADALIKEAQAMEDAATKVKTFSQLWSTLQETAQSGWAKTWEILLGDFEEAKSLFTSINDAISPLIEKMSDSRNNLLESGLSSSWKQIAKEIQKAGIDVEDFQNKLIDLGKKHGTITKDMTVNTENFESTLKKGWLNSDIFVKGIQQYTGELDKLGQTTDEMQAKLEKFQKVVSEVWRGDYGNDPLRHKALEEAGYDYATVQDLVNKTLDGHKLTLEDLNEKQAANIGLTKDQIKVLSELGKQAKQTGTPINDLIKNLTRPTGRELLFDSIKNLLQPISTILKSIGDAWHNAFQPMTGEQLYKVIDAFHNFTNNLKITDEAAKNLTRTFKGVFAVLDIFASFMGGTIGFTFGVVSKAIEALWVALGFGADNILEITAKIGDMLVKLRDWIEEMDFVGKAITAVVNILVNLGKEIKKVIDSVMASEKIQGMIEKVTSTFQKLADTINKNFGEPIKKLKELMDVLSKPDADPKAIETAVSNLGKSLETAFHNINFEQVGRDIISGLGRGIGAAAELAWTAAVEVAQKLIEKVRSIFKTHSPSRVFMEIGKDLIDGLVLGIQNGLQALAEIAKTIFDTLVGFFKDVDFTDVFLMGGFISILLLIKKFLNILNVFSSVAKGAGKILTGFGNILNSLSKFIDARSMALKAEAFKEIAKAIAILAVALGALTFVDPLKLWNAVAAIGALSAILAGLTFAVGKIKNLPDLSTIGKLSLLFISLGGALILLASTMKILSTINFKNCEEMLLSFGTMVAGLVAVIYATSKLVNKTPDFKGIWKLGFMFMEVAISFQLLAVALKMIASIEQADLEKGKKIIALTTAFALGLSLLAKNLNTFDFNGFGSMMLKFTASLILLSVAIKVLANLDWGSIAKAGLIGLGFSVIMGILSALTGLCKNEKALSKAGNLMLKFVLAMTLLSYAIKSIAQISEGDLDKATKCIATVTAIFGMFTLVSTLFGGENAKQAGNMILQFSASVLILGAAIKLLAGIPMGDLLKGFAIITVFGLVCKALVSVSRFAGANAAKAGAMILQISLAFAAMAIVLRMIKGMSGDDIAKGLSVISMFSVLIGALIFVSHFAGANADKAGAMLLKMTVPIAALALCIGLLSMLDQSKLRSASVSLGIVIGVFALVVVAAQTLEKGTGPILAMSVTIGILSFALFQIARLPVESALAASISLSIVLVVLSGALKVLAGIRSVSGAAFGALFSMVGAIALIAVILGILNKLEIELSIQNAISISILLATLAGVSVAMAMMGVFAPAAIHGALAIDGVIVAIGGLLVAIGALMTYIPMAEQFLDKGITVLTKIAKGLGEAIGEFFGGLGSGLPEMGQYLSDFTTNAKPFFDAIGGITPEVASGTDTVVKAITTLATCSNLNPDFSSFGENMSQLGTALQTFVDAVKDISEDNLAKADLAAQIMEKISKVYESIPTADISSKMDVFGTGVESLGKGLNDFCTKMNELPDVPEGKIQMFSSIMTTLTDLANKIPNQGGALMNIVGDNTFKDFAKGLEPLATELKTFIETIQTIPENAETSIDLVNRCVGKLVDLANTLPSTGGIFAIFGSEHMNMSAFALNLKDFGEGLASFSASISGETPVDPEKISAVAKAAQPLADLANMLPPGSAFWGLFGSQNESLSTFGSQLRNLGSGLSAFSGSVTNVDSTKVESAATCMQKLAKAMKSMDGIKADGVNQFKTAVNSLASTNVSGLLKTFSGDNLESLSSIGSKLGGGISKGIAASAKSIKSAMNSLIEAAVGAANGATGKFKAAGTKCSSEFASAVKSKSKSAKANAKSMAESAAKSAKGASSNFESAGKACAEGFANGISANTFMAEAKAKAMADAAYEAARAAIDSHSPSKVFKKLGEFVPQGMALGIERMTYLVTDSSKRMVNKAIQNTRNIVGRIADAINTDVDVNPTIRPVVDLSDVASSARVLNGMMELAPGLGTVNRLNAIGYGLNRRNSGGSEVLSAIKDLKKTISASSVNSYNINGITYDDGTNVSNAVKELIRAAKIERRV